MHVINLRMEKCRRRSQNKGVTRYGGKYRHRTRIAPSLLNKSPQSKCKYKSKMRIIRRKVPNEGALGTLASSLARFMGQVLSTKVTSMVSLADTRAPFVHVGRSKVASASMATRADAAPENAARKINAFWRTAEET